MKPSDSAPVRRRLYFGVHIPYNGRMAAQELLQVMICPGSAGFEFRIFVFSRKDKV